MPQLPTQRQTRGLKRGAVQQHAGNYITAQAQQRMLDLSRVSGEKWINSVNVEGYEAYYFNVVDGGIDCTCRANAAIRFDADPEVPDSGVISTPSFTDVVGDKSSATFQVTTRGSTFGWGDVDSDVAKTPLEDTIPSDNPSYAGMLGSIEELFEDGVDCGICHRRGLQPGYELHGHERVLLTTVTLQQDSHCHVVNDQPDLIEVADGGYAEWVLVVPRYYTSYSVSIHNNHEVLGRTLYTTANAELQSSDLDAVAGLASGIRVRCKEPQFTHVVVTFKLPKPPLKVSLPQLQKLKDYRKFLAIPVATLVITNQQPRCDHGDLVIVPSMQLMWKVSEVLPLTITDGFQVGWSLQARIVQPNERLWSILDRGFAKPITD